VQIKVYYIVISYFFQSAGQGEDTKHLCCLCCKSGPIHADFRIDRCGYVPGDTIFLNAEITNGSSRRMDASRAKLMMVWFISVFFNIAPIFSQTSFVYEINIFI